MRRLILLLATLGVFAVLGHAVWDAETLIARGETVLLRLAPRDPRSLMQGDYMALRWELERDAPAAPAGASRAIVAVDADGVASFRRIDGGEALAADERRFAVRIDGEGRRPMVEPHSFLFQEGRAAAFEAAKFGIFRLAADGRHRLVGLADAERRPIDPK